MKHWLMKSEPEAFSIEDLRRQGTAGWDGVRNYQARNYLRAMRKGDRAFFYHSSTAPPAIVGILEVVREAYPDPTQFDPRSDHYDPGSEPRAPRWDQVDVRFVRIFSRPLPLPALRLWPALKDMVLLKRGRLSVQPVTPPEWEFILKKSERTGAAGFTAVEAMVAVFILALVGLLIGKTLMRTNEAVERFRQRRRSAALAAMVFEQYGSYAAQSFDSLPSHDVSHQAPRAFFSTPDDLGYDGYAVTSRSLCDKNVASCEVSVDIDSGRGRALHFHKVFAEAPLESRNQPMSGL